MRALRVLLHLYTYLFHALLSGFLAGIAAVAMLSHSRNFTLGMIPWWSGPQLTAILLAFGALGMAWALLAMFGKFRFMLTLWALAVLAVAVYGFFFSGYTYGGLDHFKSAAWFCLAALVAFVGSVSQLFKRRRR